MKSALTIIAIAVFMLPRPVVAAENIMGDWEFEFKDTMSHGKPSSGSLTITRNADGSYAGKLSTQKGEGTLSKVGFKNGQLRFIQTSIYAGKELKTYYLLTVEGTKLTGNGANFTSRYTIEGTLEGQPKTGADAPVGKWKINITIPSIYTREMTISKNPNGLLVAKWNDNDSKISKRHIWDVNFTDPKLTFKDILETKAKTYTYFFQGTVKGDTIKGNFTREGQARETRATRVTPGKADEGEENEPNS